MGRQPVPLAIVAAVVACTTPSPLAKGDAAPALEGVAEGTGVRVVLVARPADCFACLGFAPAFRRLESLEQGDLALVVVPIDDSASEIPAFLRSQRIAPFLTGAQHPEDQKRLRGTNHPQLYVEAGGRVVQLWTGRTAISLAAGSPDGALVRTVSTLVEDLPSQPHNKERD